MQSLSSASTTASTATTSTIACHVTLTMPFLAISCTNFVAFLCSKLHAKFQCLSLTGAKKS